MNSEKTIQHIVAWLTDYVEKAGLAGFVVGVSGGIDSAVTSTLCARTGKPLIALSLPIRQKTDQVSLAEEQLRWLAGQFSNVSTQTVDLTAVFQALENSLPGEIQDDLSMANSRSRLRMVTLYTFATHHRLLVAGTGNKVEDFGVGFYTKYGDGGVDVSPIADLMKSEVYQLAEHLGILPAIRHAAPTDGLWEDARTDESQLGAAYDELEWAMRFLEQGGDPETLQARQKDVIAIYKKFHNTNRHKMLPIPVCRIPDAYRN
ncbi:MAG: NAD(+) synthase [Gammaproteobacteria bacterium]|nr:NAD(+) synthase [Gammaproteobacteria bacterium]